MTRHADATKRDKLTLEEAARSLGVSLRTVQRRIKDGDLSTIESDGARLVCLASDATEAATEAATPARQNATSDATARQIDATKRDSAPDARADLLAHLRTENEYLKSQVDAWRLQTEAANRTASETAAALREALKAMPRAIEAGSGSTASSGSTPTRENATEAAQSGEPIQPARSTPNAPQRTPQREMRPLWKVILGIR